MIFLRVGLQKIAFWDLMLLVLLSFGKNYLVGSYFTPFPGPPPPPPTPSCVNLYEWK